jgi:hypothetical protein
MRQVTQAKPDDKTTEIVFSVVPPTRAAYARIDWEKRQIVTALLPKPNANGDGWEK